jgi:hypothetical protein
MLDRRKFRKLQRFRMDKVSGASRASGKTERHGLS